MAIAVSATAGSNPTTACGSRPMRRTLGDDTGDRYHSASSCPKLRGSGMLCAKKASADVETTVGRTSSGYESDQQPAQLRDSRCPLCNRSQQTRVFSHQDQD